jgi:predicted nucleic acid-binding Zn ribbon protein
MNGKVIKNRERKCLNCGNLFLYKDIKQKFCSFKCSGLYTNKHRTWKIDNTTKIKISETLKIYNREHQQSKTVNHCIICNKEFIGRRKTCSRECYIEALRNSSIIKCGGKRNHSGRGKQGKYKGYWCDSSWELAYVIYNLEHNIKFYRYDGYFEYEWNNQKLKYYPDFMLEDGTLVEIKGYESDQWLSKLKSVPNEFKIIVLTENDIKPYIKYATEKYGKDYIKLYENKK